VTATLRNGDFEDVDDGKPIGWSKFGGTLGTSRTAFHGAVSATLASDTSSTKWIYQAVAVDPGAWLSVSAHTRIEGACEAFIRVSWYASSDGSGSSLGDEDSDSNDSTDWALLSTAAIQAPGAANSARVRLMLRPSGNCTAFFDLVSLDPADEPAAPLPTAAPTSTRATGAAATSAPTSRPSQSTSASRPAPTAAAVAESLTTSTSLRISEFLSDPAETGRDTTFEWVELVNVGEEDVNLAGWKLGDATEMDALPAAVVPPAGYVVVASRDAAFADGVPVVRTADGDIGNGLNNGGDTIRLMAPDGSIADELSYGSDTSVFDPAPKAPGVAKTLGARDPLADPGGDNWSATLRPTPGEPNVFPATTSPTPTAGATKPPKSPGGAAASVLASGGGGNGPSVVPWVILGVLGAAGAFVVFGAAGPKAGEWVKRRRGR
jgi:hypothetical protein